MDWENLFHINLREHGSGNTGTTNTFRILGKKAGVIVFTIDFLERNFGRSPSDFFGIQGISPMVFGLLAVFGAHFPNFCWIQGWKSSGDECWCFTWFLAYPATHFSCLFCSQPLFNQHDFVFECYRCATRNSIGPPSPLTGWILHNYDPLLQSLSWPLATLIILRHKDNIQRIKEKKKNLIPWERTSPYQQPKLEQAL